MGVETLKLYPSGMGIAYQGIKGRAKGAIAALEGREAQEDLAWYAGGAVGLHGGVSVALACGNWAEDQRPIVAILLDHALPKSFSLKIKLPSIKQHVNLAFNMLAKFKKARG